MLNSVDALICSTDGIGRPPPLFATDESSQSLTSDVDRCDVSWVRDCLEQANAEYLDSSWLDSPKPAGERTSIDFVSEVGEVWYRHRFSRLWENVRERMVFQIWTVQSGGLRAGSMRGLRPSSRKLPRRRYSYVESRFGPHSEQRASSRYIWCMRQPWAYRPQSGTQDSHTSCEWSPHFENLNGMFGAGNQEEDVPSDLGDDESICRFLVRLVQWRDQVVGRRTAGPRGHVDAG